MSAIVICFFHVSYEERARALDTIIEQYSEATTFEAFISSVYCPVFPATFTSGPTRASGKPLFHTDIVLRFDGAFYKFCSWLDETLE